MDYKSLSDAALFNLLRANDEVAFQEIYLRHWKRLLTIARNKLALTDSPEDVVQDLFVKLWENRQTQFVENPAAYLTSALRHAIINVFRNRLVREKYVVHVQASPAAEYNTENQVALNDLVSSVHRQVGELPEKTREIFMLNRFEFKSAREISSQLHISERTVEYHISHALKTLKPYFTEYFLLILLILRFK
ncbi:RNA polymerase sigma-70 factor [Dyadobacter sp. CY312]|jgi:RNA polymerase sigma-70 factor (family 1)|uniref:RNA polymerase sigma-70 factor n=1 Tax=Dyadobacter sp. CY312 TaxID=2907303 RepID=UPI001F2B84A8|nr:RNA polymerase sigma-70 factor [Dyadobacter sp. CY312]MCE7039612.1 RNA polymerase sigma-70 factor [Dyadobacter sp. CY312]